MSRYLVLMLLSTIIGFAQDTARMDLAGNELADGDHFMGNVLVAKDAEIVFEHSYGWANAEWKIPHTQASRFSIGSLTKQFTAAAILVLEERGKLKLDDPIAKFIPEAPETWQKITLFHLLTHTSGIRNYTDMPDYKTWQLAPEGPAETFAHFRDEPLGFAPGEEFKYSNSGYLLLGWIIERISGQSYEDFLRVNILQPLGMNDSGYDWNTALIPQRASGYWHRGPNRSLSNAPYDDRHGALGSGALYSTTGDLLRWTQGLFGGKLLSAASLGKMTTAYKDDYAFGLFVRTVNGRKVIEHGGAIGGFNAQLAYYPESKVTIVVLSNTAGTMCADLATKLTALNFGDPLKLASERKEVAVPAAILQRYVGVYQLKPKVTNTIRFTDGQLTTQLSGQAVLPAFAESETKFFLKVVDAQGEFFTDELGRITHLIQYQNGRTTKWVRISDTVVERKAIHVPAALLATYAGTYEMKPGFDLVITVEGDQLQSQATGQKKAPLWAETETSFFFRVVDAQIEFVRNDQGEIDQLILHQGSRDTKGKRKAAP